MIDRLQQQLTLAMHIRTHMAGSGYSFTPLDGLELKFKADNLCRVAIAHNARMETPICAIDDLYSASDEAIWDVVMNGTPIPSKDIPLKKSKRFVNNNE